MLEEACPLRLELPTRSAAQIGAILYARHRLRVAERTIREHFQRRGLQRAALAGQPRAFGRFEADRPNEVWIGDVLVGPFVPYPRTNGSKRAYLFLVEDYSRLLLQVAGYLTRTRAPARMCYAPPSSAAACRNDCTSITAAPIGMLRSNAAVRCWGSA